MLLTYYSNFLFKIIGYHAIWLIKNILLWGNISKCYEVCDGLVVVECYETEFKR